MFRVANELRSIPKRYTAQAVHRRLQEILKATTDFTETYISDPPKMPYTPCAMSWNGVEGVLSAEVCTGEIEGHHTHDHRFPKPCIKYVHVSGDSMWMVNNPGQQELGSIPYVVPEGGMNLMTGSFQPLPSDVESWIDGVYESDTAASSSSKNTKCNDK